MKRYRSPLVYVLAALLIALVVVLKKSKKPSETGPRIEERLAEGRTPRLLDDIRYANYWAGVGNAIALGGLIATFPWWGGRRKDGTGDLETGGREQGDYDVDDDVDPADDKSQEHPPDAARPGMLRSEVAMRAGLFWVVLLSAVVLAGVLRWNLAHRSLWVDELLASKQAIVGYFPSTGEDRATFKPATWEKTFYYYSKPRNHVVFSALSRSCHLTWLHVSGEPEHKFDEFVFRLPSFVAALLSVALVGILLKRWGLPWAGLLAAFLLAVHPWHIRYGIDGRSYSLTILFILASMVFLTSALKSGRWRSWIGFGTCQFLMLWGSMTTLWIAVLFFIVGVVVIWKKSGISGTRRLDLARLLVVNVFAAMLFFQLMAPNLLQISRWDFMEGGKSYPALTWNWVGTTLHELVWGDVELEISILDLRPRNSVLLALVPFFFWGGLAIYRRNQLAFLLCSAVVGAAAVFLIFTAIQNYFYFPRFLSYLVVPFCLFCAAGAMDLARILFGINQFGPPLTVFLVTSLFVFMNQPRLELLLERPIEPIRDVVEYVESKDAEGGAVGIAFGHGADLARQYDPSIVVARDLEEILRAAALAYKNQKIAYIFFGHEKLLDSSNSPANQFLRVHNLYGFEDGLISFLAEPVTFQGLIRNQDYQILACPRMTDKHVDFLLNFLNTDNKKDSTP